MMQIVENYLVSGNVILRERNLFFLGKFARRQRHREKNVHRISFFSNRELETRLETRKNDDLEILTPPLLLD